MDDYQVHEKIEELVKAEQDLREVPTDSGDAAQRANTLKSLEVQLDRCWDLLRQRQAKRDAGENPNAAHSRSAAEVEGYVQ